MNIKHTQPYTPENELGSREEVEVHEQRAKELEKYDNRKNKSSKYRIITFIATLILIATMLVFVVIKPNKNKNIVF